MSNTKPPKRPTPILKEPTSPLRTLTPQSQSKAKLPTAGSSTTGSGDSPERANKKARFSYDGAGDAAGAPVPERTLSQVGRGMSGGWGGAVWVTDRVAELEVLYKECIAAATFLLQYKAYSQKFGVINKRTPLHLSRRLETAWSRYSALRSHIEAYLLRCAQSANETSPSQSLPTPSSLVPGLAALPPTPSIPNTASNLLQTTPHPGRAGPVSLEKLLAADPARGLVGYQKGQLVFPGVPTDIAMPIPAPPPISNPQSALSPTALHVGNGIKTDPEKDGDVIDLTGSEIMPISLPGVDYGAPADESSGGGLGMDINMGDLGGGMDLDSLNIAELSALINGDGGGVSGSNGLNDQSSMLGGMNAGLGLGMGGDPSGLLESLNNQYGQNEGSFPTLGESKPTLSITGSTANPSDLTQYSLPTIDIDTRTSGSVPISMTNVTQLQQQSQQSLPPSFNQQLSQPPQRQQQQQAQPVLPTPSQNFDFDFSTLDGTDGLDPLDGLADIDFNELAGMFGGTSGRTTRAQSPVGGASTSAPPPNLASSQFIDNSISSQSQQLPDLGLALSNLYPGGHNEEQQPMQASVQVASAFDASLGGIDLDDFDFTGGDGEDGMPGVDGDEFESMFAEFK